MKFILHPSAFILLLFVAGCTPRPGTNHAKPSPQPDRNAVMDAADGSMDAVRSALADVADEMATKADTFKSWEDFYTAWSKRNEECQPPKFLPWTDALNSEFGFEKQADGTVKATKDYDAAKAASAARDSAKGFRGKGK